MGFVLPTPKDVSNYVDKRHPVILTLNGQNHGEMTNRLIANANLPELSSSMIVEVRLDHLEQEAQSHIISNSRENPKNTTFTRSLTDRLVELLRNDEALQELERKRQEQRTAAANQELSQRLSSFLSGVLSDALSKPATQGAGDGRGGGGVDGGGEGEGSRPEVPPADPPNVIEFVSGSPMVIAEGITRLAKFRTDARPPKYVFHGDNPRLFVRLEPNGDAGARVTIVGRADINSRGYGSVSLHCAEDSAAPIAAIQPAGRLVLTLQSADGRVLSTTLEIAIGPKPEARQRKRAHEVRIELRFCASGGDSDGTIKSLLGGDEVVDFGAYLGMFRDSLSIPDKECAYWGERYERDGAFVLGVEINAGNASFLKMLQACRTAEERFEAKERYCRDVVLDCYQHCFRLEDVPDPIQELVSGRDDAPFKAAEMFLNHDKAIRFVNQERLNAGPKAY